MEERPYQAFVETPVGMLHLMSVEEGLLFIKFVDPQYARFRETRESATIWTARDELREYFAGERHEFNVRLAPRGTVFQRRVWDAVRAIPFGETRSYAQIASTIGAPRAVRAVGAANALNRWPIIIPCHRVVGSDGRLTGYAGGLERKEWLLRHEGALALA
jgi:methylated-DNA-[protein]-cysteine S-methyltransferase